MAAVPIRMIWVGSDSSASAAIAESSASSAARPGVDRISEGLAVQIEGDGDPLGAGHRILERLPEVLLPAVRAHHQQGVERLGEDGIASVQDTLSALDRTDEQTMGGRDVAVGVQQERGRGDRRLEGSLELHVAPTELGEHVRGVAQVTGHVGADVGGRCQSPVSLCAPRAELRRSESAP